MDARHERRPSTPTSTDRAARCDGRQGSDSIRRERHIDDRDGAILTALGSLGPRGEVLELALKVGDEVVEIRRDPA